MSRWARPYGQEDLAVRRAIAVVASVVVWSFVTFVATSASELDPPAWPP